MGIAYHSFTNLGDGLHSEGEFGTVLMLEGDVQSGWRWWHVGWWATIDFVAVLLGAVGGWLFILVLVVHRFKGRCGWCWWVVMLFGGGVGRYL